MGFRQIKLFEFNGGPDDPEVLRVSLRNGKTLYVSPSYDNYPMPTPYVIKPDHMPAWLGDRFDELLRVYAENHPEMVGQMPRDHSEAKGLWAVTVHSRLSPDVDLVMRFGRTNVLEEIEANDIINMMSATATDAIIDARGSQSAHS